jgi:succinoglycan biosynthesis protein ExoL
MSKTLIFVSSHRRHKKVADRLLGAIAAGCKIELFSFDRGEIDHPVYSHPDISHTSLGKMRDGVAASRLFATARAAFILRRARRHTPKPDTMLIVNNLELLVVSWLTGLTRSATIYDVADIHKLQLSGSMLGKFSRWIERKALKRVRLIVVSSPWFYWRYFADRLATRMPAVLIENRVSFTSTAPPGGRSPDARSSVTSIAWNGLLRCRTSASVLLECLDAGKDSFSLSLHGTIGGLNELGQRLVKHPNCFFSGPYDALMIGTLLSQSSFVWAIDFSEEENSRWLLPNRLYEAVGAGIPLLAVDGTATADVVRHYNIGVVLSDCNCRAILAAVRLADSPEYAVWLANLQALKSKSYSHNEWQRVFDSAIRWSRLKFISGEVDVSLVLCGDAP